MGLGLIEIGEQRFTYNFSSYAVFRSELEYLSTNCKGNDPFWTLALLQGNDTVDFSYFFWMKGPDCALICV